MTVLVVLLFAAALRLSGVDWDGGIAAHPDERYVVGVAEGLSWGQLDPFAVAPEFPYGHLPLYLLALAGGADRLMTARLVAGLADVGTVALAAALGCRLAGRRAGLLAAAFLAAMPLHVQQAHFGTVDALLALCVTAALLFAIRLAQSGRWPDAALAGLWGGLALGCKAAALLLALPLAAAWAMAPGSRRGRLARGALLVSVAASTFAVTNPFALLEGGRFLGNVAGQAAMARGASLLPYTLQYHATWPYLYPFWQQFIWGMGPLMAVLCFGGLGLAVWQAARRPAGPAAWVALAWALPFWAFTAGLYVKFPRYLLPLTPLLAAYGGAAAGSLHPRWLRRLAALLALAPALLLSLTLIASYRRPHPWIAASAWLRANLPPGSTIAVEAWDHPLPLDAAGYNVRILPLFDAESPQKWAAVEEALAEADALVIASRRGYGALARWPERFPQTADYYRALFAGESSFTAAACFERWPRLGLLALTDDPFRAADMPCPSLPCLQTPALRLPRLDESFVVYDRPLVLVFR
jgi:4-amino-4-deoxy-L-arabinose transferase-like glycosyltransferase